MGSSTNQEINDKVFVILVPFPAQGHLNQLIQLACLISSREITVHYIGSATHNRQAKIRANGLNPQDLAKIHFHDIPTPPFASPSPNPNSSNKFPAQLQPSWDATLILRQPIYKYFEKISSKYRRIVVIHDPLMAFVVQDVTSIHNAESYAFNCISTFTQAAFVYEKLGKEFPIKIEKELPSIEGCIPDDIGYFLSLHTEPNQHRSGDIYNTCRLIEAPYLDILASEELVGNRKSWAIGPILPAKSLERNNKHECFEWLDKQVANSVLFVTFGTTTSLSDEEIHELAMGLERSEQKFVWVLRDADKGDVFDEQVRSGSLPEGFEERLKGVGLVIRDWAPQPEILAHFSIGGFMSHCGWNSCIESITMGVPIAAWPMHSDQPRNAVLITEILRVGIFVREWDEKDELVKASRIESVVKRLMASEEGDEIRKRAEALADDIAKATEEGGVSRLEFDSFIAHISR